MKLKNPNGYGSIIKLSGKRRKPFAVRVTAGWSNKGKQIYRYVGYYSNLKEANQKLVDYNKNPYNLDGENVTFEDVFEKWKKRKYTVVGHSAQLGYNAAFKTANLRKIMRKAQESRFQKMRYRNYGNCQMIWNG